MENPINENKGLGFATEGKPKIVLVVADNDEKLGYEEQLSMIRFKAQKPIGKTFCGFAFVGDFQH